ncbi:CynX/NimT family MFS transporter [Burkholderia pseudomallei]|uniref:MFS transporter n=1 Tax=Burkholderia pseudomallei TaxID=28450 RepID=UPI000A1A1C07|nr:MFS transporter [Burkholderia pseudomallei]ARK96028.1 hypothetical protein BOC43_16115 [Burkholderia pseudomallei]
MNRRFAVEAILFSSYVLFSAAWMAGTMSMHEIMSQASIRSLTSASSLTTALTIAKIAGTAVSAWLMSKIGIRRAVSLSAVLVCFGLLTPFATSWSSLFASRFLLGLGGAFMVVYLNPVVVGWFSGRELTFVNGLNNMAFNLGIALAAFVVPWSASYTGNWRAGLVILSSASVAFTILWALFGRSAAEETNHANARSNGSYRFRDGLRDPFTWIYTFMYSGLLSFYIVLFTFYPNAGIKEAKYVLVAGIAGGIAGTIFSGRIRRRMAVLRFSGAVQLLSAITLSFASSHSIALVSAILLGFFLIFPMATVFTVGQKQPGMTQASISVRYSIFWSACYIVATAVTTIFAKIVDMNGGDYDWALIFICAVEGSFFAGSLLLKDKGNECVVDPHSRAAAVAS